jgi:mannose-6-phosphate isomerase-like protein (cupin superfamily)
VSDYTQVNLKSDVEDMAPKFGFAPDVEARFARTNLEMTKGGLSYQRLEPNVRFPFAHTHAEQEEVYVVTGGGGRMKIGDDIIDVAQWDSVRVSPGVIRGFESGGDGMEILAFGAPGNDNKDVEMHQDWWTD